jgi:hypothetical protein
VVAQGGNPKRGFWILRPEVCVKKITIRENQHEADKVDWPHRNSRGDRPNLPERAFTLPTQCSPTRQRADLAHAIRSILSRQSGSTSLAGLDKGSI